MTTNSLFTHEIGRIWPVIDNQDQLVQDLEIALGLVYFGSTVTAKETGAKIMLELSTCRIAEPANWIEAVLQAKKNIGINNNDD